MVLQNKELEVLYHVIRGTEGQLKLSEGRKRDAFAKPVIETLKTFEENRKIIFEKFCDKNEDGTSDLHDNQYHFKKEVSDEMFKELNVLLDESVTIEASTEGLKDILERTQYTPKIGEAEIIDGIFAKI